MKITSAREDRTVRRLASDILIALAISIVINISYFIFMFGPGGRGPTATNQNYLNLVIQIAFYFIHAFCVIKIATVRDGKSSEFWWRLFICLILSIGFYYITPYFNRAGDLRFAFQSTRPMHPMNLLKTSFTFIVSVLYAKIIALFYQRQRIIVENQMLKTENLESKYSTLVNQINPHFFFNSLNSLSMLVRSGDDKQALTYIDRLSDTFRYIIQNGEKGMVTLGEELRFVESYKYLFEIRYASKLFFDVEVEESNLPLMLPSLSLQPLIENAVKHNTITTANPLRITISAKGGYLTVYNPLRPKIKPEPGTGVGLKNLASRFQLLTGKDIEIVDDGATFSVRLPLSQPDRI